MSTQTAPRSDQAIVASLNERHEDDTAQEMLTRRQSRFAFLAVAVVLLVGVAVAYLGRSVLGWHLAWHDYVDAPIGLMLVVYLVALVVRVIQVVSAKLETTRMHHVQLIDPDRTDWPSYTVLVPLFHEGNVVHALIDSLRQIDYPAQKLQLILLLEKDDADTIGAVDRLMANGGLPSNFEWVFVPESEPRTKPKALNHGLLVATGTYLVIFDAEDVPEPDQLKKAVVALEGNEGLACVQARLEYWNSQENLLTRWFAAEYAMHFFLLLPGLSRRGWPVPLGGTSNHFRTETIRELGGWDAYNVTEDADLGLRIARDGARVGIIDSVTLEEANSKPRSWVRQRSRWIKGYIQTWLVHMRSPIKLWRELGPANFLAFQAIVGGSWFVPLINPIFWGLSLAYVFTQATAIKVLFPPVLFYPGLALMIAGNFLYLYTFMMGAFEREEQEGNGKAMLLLPLYFVMMSVAAYKALGQLLNPARRHYWEKTEHGLTGEKSSEPVSDPLALGRGIPSIEDVFDDWPAAIRTDVATTYAGMRLVWQLRQPGPPAIEAGDDDVTVPVRTEQSVPVREPDKNGGLTTRRDLR